MPGVYYSRERAIYLCILIESLVNVVCLRRTTFSDTY